MWIEYNPNPCGRKVGDCAVRAIAKALDLSWEDAFILIADNAYAMCDMPSSDSVWGAVLRQNGFYRKAIPNTCPDCYTVADFAREPRLTSRAIYVPIMDELMSTVEVLVPKLYNAVIQKMRET